MHSQYNPKKRPARPKAISPRLTLHYMLNGKPICQAEYQLQAGERYIEIPLPVRMLNR